MSEMELAERLEKLERDNRRMKRLALLALVLAVALGAMYTASCSPAGRRSGTQGVLNKIAAREFDLLDASGKVRVKIAMDCSIPKDCWPVIRLYDRDGKALTVIGAGTLNISGKNSSAALYSEAIQFRGTWKGQWRGQLATLGLGVMGPGGALTLTGRGGAMSVELVGQSVLPGGEGGVLDLMGKNGNSVFLNSDSPMVEIADGKGSYMDLGRTGLIVPRTGATEQTSAASIVMFGNDKKHHVIWQAP